MTRYCFDEFNFGEFDVGTRMPRRAIAQSKFHCQFLLTHPFSLVYLDLYLPSVPSAPHRPCPAAGSSAGDHSHLAQLLLLHTHHCAQPSDAQRAPQDHSLCQPLGFSFYADCNVLSFLFICTTGPCHSMFIAGSDTWLLGWS